MRFSQRRACAKCGISYEELGPHQFSFNSQLGWCETCEGLGVQRGAPASQLIARPDKSILGGAIAGWGSIERGSTFAKMLTALCLHLDVDVDTPLRDWPAAAQQTLLFGTPPGTWISSGKTFPGVRFGWRGFFPTIDAATRNSWELRHKLHQVVTEIPCTTCRGGRLRPDAAAAKLSGRTIVDVCDWPLEQVAEFFAKLRLDAREKRIAGELLLEIRHRLQFLLDVGLEYLHLHRAAPTLSGGEAQRIRLASQIGSGLTGVLYVLDEPTIGLHPRDNARLIAALRKLRGLGNTLLLVEHDREVIASADRVIDFGPAAGRGGGYVVANDAPAALRSAAAPAARPPAPVDGEDSMQSLTRGYLSGALAIPVPSNRRPTHWPDWPAIEAERDSTASNRRSRKALAAEPPANAATTEWLTIHGARHNNLKELTVPFPLARFICVTGVSGSGKSSLINDILWPALANKLNRASLTPGAHHSISGLKRIDKVINVDQDPIGFTPASNPATYTGAFDLIRELFARLPESKVRGYTANKFSFNRPGGRCEACEGNGQKKIEMHFMADVWVECETCRGRRYTLETLEVKFKGKSIADVLELSAREALELFSSVPKVRRLLQTLVDVGLDYVPLGQSAATLSGGEAQRVKLATELGKPDTGQTLYLLDEPTTGLHFDDIRKLLDVMQRLVDLGNTVVVVEHNLDVIKCADWLIELGPEAGAAGGHLIALGSPEDLINGEAASRCHCSVSSGLGKRAVVQSAKNVADPATHTARALQPVLAESPKIERKAHDRKALAAQQLADEKAGFGSVGKEVKAPWQIDGRAWHLNGRRSRTDKPVRWEAAALEFVLETVQKSGAFAPTDWNNRASVEITAPDAPQWFLHALTGGEWLIECYFRVPPGTFQAVRLNAELGLKTLDQRDDLQTYGSFPRVDVRERQDGLDAVVVYVHDKAEIDTPAFRRFVKQAAKAYFDSFA
ncbi:MAG: hypothetical protein SF069_14330 [Phycisphaerae bacterium]|nr:hypothetical protein [Phycisphaerae bacterium]